MDAPADISEVINGVGFMPPAMHPEAEQLRERLQNSIDAFAAGGEDPVISGFTLGGGGDAKSWAAMVHGDSVAEPDLDRVIPAADARVAFAGAGNDGVSVTTALLNVLNEIRDATPRSLVFEVQIAQSANAPTTMIGVLYSTNPQPPPPPPP